MPAQTPPDGEAAPAQDAKRMARLATLERLRDRAERINEKLCCLIEGTLSDEEREPFARIADPVLAFTRSATAIRRIVALEEQIDQSAEERGARLAAEAAKRAAEAARPPADRRIHLRASQRIAHDAIRAAITARNGDIGVMERHALLCDLTSDLNLPDYADDMDLVLDQIETELDAIIGPAPDGGAANDDDEAPPKKGRGELLTQLHTALKEADAAIARARRDGG